MKIFTKTYELSDEAFNFLVSLKDRCAEYRDSEYDDLEDFRANNKSNRSDDWFLARNHNGTFKLAMELYELGFVADDDGMSWHRTYVLSDLGKEAVEQITSTQYVRNETLEKLLYV